MNRMNSCVTQPLLAIILMVNLAACNGQGNKKTVTQETKSENKPVAVENKTDTVVENNLENCVKKTDTEVQIVDTSDKIQPSCSQIEKYNEGMDDAILMKTCFFKKFKSVSTGTPDYKGRYSWEYLMLRMVNGKYVEVKNSEIFNEKQAQLIALINKKIYGELKKYASDPETKECLDGVDITQQYAIDDLGIDFENNQFNFTVSLGLGSACYVVDMTTISFNFDEIQCYLK